jgi:hypothetical protein
VREELVVWGGTLAGRIGRNLTVTADEKIMENLGGTQQSSTALLSLLAIFSIFSLLNYHIQIDLNARATV